MPPAAGAAMRIVAGAGRASTAGVGTGAGGTCVRWRNADRQDVSRPPRRPGVRDHSHAAMPMIAGASVITSTRSGGSPAKASAIATSSQES